MSNQKRQVQIDAPRQEMPKAKKFRCGQKILDSGIYRVVHRDHRLAHEVTLLRGQLFPKCTQCENSVLFELLRSAPEITKGLFKVTLYALPAADEEEENEKTAAAY